MSSRYFRLGELVSEKAKSLGEIASREDKDERHIRRLLALAFVDPRYVRRLIAGEIENLPSISSLAKNVSFEWDVQQ